MVRRSLGSGMVSFAAFQNDLPILGISGVVDFLIPHLAQALKVSLPLVRR